MLKILLERGRMIGVVQVYAFGSLVSDVNITEKGLTVRTKASPPETKTLEFGCQIDKEKVSVHTSQLGDFVSVRAPVLSAPDEGVSYSNILLRTLVPTICDLYCNSCSARFTSSPFSKTLILPSKYWREISDLWTCEVDDFQQFARDEIFARPDACLLGKTFALVHAENLDLRSLVLEGPCGSLRAVSCARCGVHVALAYLDHSVGMFWFIHC